MFADIYRPTKQQYTIWFTVLQLGIQKRETCRCCRSYPMQCNSSSKTRD